MMKIEEVQQYMVQLLAECFATCVLILIGEGTIANYKFSQQTSHSTLPVAIAFGIGTYSGNIEDEIFLHHPLINPCLLSSIDDCWPNYRYEKDLSMHLTEFNIDYSIGAHLNPALSISLMTIRKLKPLQCIFYVIGQILGAFLGAALIYLVYIKQFDQFDGGIRQTTGPNGTADIFFTMSAKGLPQWNTLVDQIVGTAILLIFVLAVTHVRE
jgi:glycerol uptake facilitator-like aquaporin